jgi:protein-disulfide isomerase
MTRSMVKDRGDWNCGLYCGVVMPLVPSRMEDTMCWEIDYKLFAEQKKAQEIRIKQERRAGVIDQLLNEANTQGEKSNVEGTPVKEAAPAK